MQAQIHIEGKMGYRKLAALICIVALGACGQPEDANAAPINSNASQQSGSAIQRVISPSAIGTTLAYTEHLLGTPAMRSNVDPIGVTRNIYQVGDCTVSVGVKNGKVVAVGMWLKPGACDIEVSGLLFQQRPVMASSTRYRDWSQRGPLHFVDEQIPSCNACGEGFPMAYVNGTSAGGLFDVMLSGWDNLDKADPWKDAIRNSGINLERLPITKDNCPLQRFDDLGARTMGNTPVESIQFGERGTLQPVCNARTAQTYRGGEYIGLD